MAVYKCKECDAKFYSTVDCEAHQKEAHADLENSSCVPVQYRCTKCGLVYGHWTDVINHGRREHGLLSPTYEELEVTTVPS